MKNIKVKNKLQKENSIMELNNESKTLFIPLYGKAMMSKNNLFINDPKAEEIISKVKFNFEDLKQSKWLSMYMALRAKIIDEIDLDNQSVLIVAEGLTMYLSEQELQQLIKGLNSKFSNATIVFDAYSKQAVKGSKIKNPVNQMNANIKWGMNNPDDFNKLNHNLKFIKEYLIRHKENNLKGMTKFIFDNLYCGKISESLYKIYEFELRQKQDDKTER